MSAGRTGGAGTGVSAGRTGGAKPARRVGAKPARKVRRRELDSPLTPLEDALPIVLGALEPLPPRRVPLAEALGCILAADVLSPRDVPGFANSAMDGYAVRATDLAGATRDRPVRLQCAFEIPAGPGRPPALAAGHCAKIFTGAPMARGADSVVPVEEISAGRAKVSFFAPVKVGRHVRPADDSLAMGDLLLPAGALLGPASIGLLASAGIAWARVHPRPRVAVISTGDEVVEPGKRAGYGQIHDANGAMVAAMAERMGATTVVQTRVADSRAALDRAVATATRKADLVVLSGGVSVGEHDWAREAIGKVLLWRVSIKPGKPFAFALHGKAGDHTPVMALPGNPGAAACAFAVFGYPAIATLAGRPLPERRLARLAAAIEGDKKRLSLVRCSVSTDRGGAPVARPSGRQASSVLSSFAGVNALALVPPGGLRKGSKVETIPFPETFPELGL